MKFNKLKLPNKILGSLVVKDSIKIISVLKNKLTAVYSRTISFIKLVPQKIKNIPSWIFSRPSAIAKFIKADRKKKKYRSFRLQKKIKPEPRYIPPSGKLLRSSIIFLINNYKIFLAIFFIHLVAYFIVIRTPVNTDISTIQDSIKTVLGEDNSKTIGGNLATLGAVLGAGGGSTQSGALQGVSVLVVTLVNIWAIRQVHNKQKIKARDAYYQGLSPILPATIILVLIALQLIPFAVAALIYSTARSGGLFITGFEDLSFFVLAIVIGILSFYWVTSTIIAFFIVTLPGMYPVKSLRSAKNLVQFQRFTVFRRILFLPVILGISYLLILLLIIRFLPSQALLFAELYGIIIIPLVSVYLYKLYRALI